MLSRGSLEQTVGNRNQFPNANYQIIEAKRTQRNPSELPNIRLAISDGIWFYPALLNKKLVHLWEDNSIKLYSIIKLTRCIYTDTKDRIIMVITELEIIDSNLTCQIRYNEGNLQKLQLSSNQSQASSQVPSSQHGGRSFTPQHTVAPSQTIYERPPSPPKPVSVHIADRLHNNDFDDRANLNDNSNSTYLLSQLDLSQQQDNDNQSAGQCSQYLSQNYFSQYQPPQPSSITTPPPPLRQPLNQYNQPARPPVMNNRPQMIINNQPPAIQSVQSATITTPTNTTTSTAENNVVHYKPIGLIHPYIINWMILGRVIQKGEIVHYERNSRDGQLFNITIKGRDDAEIQGTFFNEQVTKYYDLIKVNDVYEFSGGVLKNKNARFNPTSHDYEIAFDSSTVVRPVADDGTIKKLTYNFIKLSEIQEKPNDSYVDIILYVIQVSEITNINTKSNRSLIKRALDCCDDSLYRIEVTIWGDQATNFNGENGCIIALKNARINEFHGKALNASLITVNPQASEAMRLLSWASNGIEYDKLQTLTSSGRDSTFILFSDIISQNIGDDDKTADYFSAYCVFKDIPGSKYFYFACSNPSCRYKGLINRDGVNLCCQSCGTEYGEDKPPKRRYNFQVYLSDFTGTAFASVLGEDSLARPFTGYNVDEFAEKFLQDPNNSNNQEFRQYISQKFFTPLKVRLRAKTDNFDNKRTKKLTLVGVEPVNYVEATQYYLQLINEYESLE